MRGKAGDTAMTTVILPSAKVVTKDLQGIGKFPAIIYPVDQKRMIDLFNEQYIDFYDIEVLNVVAYEEYLQVKRKIGDQKRVNVLKLDELRDIGHTISYSIHELGLSDDDFLIINFADVAVFEKLDCTVGDRCFYSDEDISSKWTYFNEQGGRITTYYDKIDNTNEIDTNHMFIGLFHITRPYTFAQMIDVEDCAKGESDTLWKALKKYSELYKMEMIKVDEWFDVGHIDKYYDMQMVVKSRIFNHITIDKDRGILTKKSDEKDKFIGEIQWYLKLPSDVEYARPRIFSYSVDYNSPYISMEYYAYHTLHELFLLGDLSDEQWTNIFRRIRFILNDFRRYSVKDTDLNGSLKAMYIDKTLSRIQSMIDDEGFPNFDETLVINGVSYVPLNQIYHRIEELTEKYLLDVAEFHIIHGDLCFSNIMIDPNYSFIKLIDPRGKFGKYDIYGDQRYELAKLMHSVNGKYDYIIQDRFSISSMGG